MTHAPTGTPLAGRLAGVARAGYVRAARSAGALAAATGMLPATPPDHRQQRLRHWLGSLPRVHDSIALLHWGVPWWTYRAIDAVESWIAARPRPVRAFEYGAGASSAWLADRVDELVTVEHDSAFAEVLRPELADRGSVTMFVVPPVPAERPAVPSQRPGNEGLDFADYVAAIDRAGGRFDVIVIDGRAREACLERAVPRLADGGLIVFDNSRRARYTAAIRASGLTEFRLRGLTPTLPYPDQTSLLLRRA